MINLIRYAQLTSVIAILCVMALAEFPSDAFACERCQQWGPFYKETKEAMSAMDAAMKQADDQLTGDPDRDFIALMIPHHQAAIDMAKAVLLHGTDPALGTIAQEIIAEQSVEIAYLQKILVRPAPSRANGANLGSAKG